MSDEKIDLANIEGRARFDVEFHGPSDFASDVLALVAAARAARNVIEQFSLFGEIDHRGLKRLEGCLAPFTDSAENKA